MGYSWTYLGDATIPDENREAWLAASAASFPHGAVLGTPALEGWGLHDPDVEDDATTVRDVLTALAEELGAVVRFEEGPIVVHVVADKSMDAWLTYRANLAAAFVALGTFGGRGALTVVGFLDGPDDGFELTVMPEGSTARSLGAQEVETIRTSERFAGLLDAYDQAMRAANPELADLIG